MILSVFFVIAICTISFKVYSSKSTGWEYLVRIQEQWLNDVKRTSKDVGLVYREKIISNVYVFEDNKDNTTLVQNVYSPEERITFLKNFFGGMILELELRNYSMVTFGSLRTDTLSTPRTDFSRWILKRSPGTCWPYYGMDVQEAWSLGYTGLGVRVAVVDNGVNILHPDLEKQVDKDISRSFVDQDPKDLKPQRFYNYILETDEFTSHGTMAAGLIAGEFGNGNCSAGIAYNATIIDSDVPRATSYGVYISQLVCCLRACNDVNDFNERNLCITEKLLKQVLKALSTNESVRNWISEGFVYSDEHLPSAFVHERDNIDIYSCSFNRLYEYRALPLDTKTALQEGVEKGRKGKGNIFVFSAGNIGGSVHDCNVEAFASNENTITIASVGLNGTVPMYSIPCASILASTHGEYKTINGPRKLETASHGWSCDDFGGTSASAALASGIIALSLQANPNLTWRCVQHIIVLTASLRKIQPQTGIFSNDAGFKCHQHFGFGLMNATAMVLLAKNWTNVPQQYENFINEQDPNHRYESSRKIIIKLQHECQHLDKCVNFTEHVLVTISYKNSLNNLDIALCSPRKTCSDILRGNPKRKKRSAGTKTDLDVTVRSWTFKSVHFWGESPQGTWILVLLGIDALSCTNMQLISVNMTVKGTISYPYPADIDIWAYEDNTGNASEDSSLYNNLTAEMPASFQQYTRTEKALYDRFNIEYVPFIWFIVIFHLGLFAMGLYCFREEIKRCLNN